MVVWLLAAIPILRAHHDHNEQIEPLGGGGADQQLVRSHERQPHPRGTYRVSRQPPAH